MKAIIKLLTRRAPRPAATVPVKWVDVPSVPAPTMQRPVVGIQDWISEEVSRA